MSSEDRRDIREPERVGIVVSGKDLEGHPFEEQTESIDISAVGISFYLKTLVSPRCFISVELGKSTQFGYLGKVTAVVARLEDSPSGKRLVAAEFV
jgi:hypothetical protein